VKSDVAGRANGRAGGAARAVALGMAWLAASACSWFTGFVEQPKVDPWEAMSYPGNTLQPSRGNPQYSVPITGTFVAGFQVSYSPFPATLDSMSGLKNPTAPTAGSLANGRKLYQINCALCHSSTGVGIGPVGRYGLPAPGVTTDHAKGLTDGYLWGMMRNGRGAMPTYNRIDTLREVLPTLLDQTLPAPSTGDFMLATFLSFAATNDQTSST